MIKIEKKVKTAQQLRNKIYQLKVLIFKKPFLFQ